MGERLKENSGSKNKKNARLDDKVREEMIREKAHEIYQRRGGEDDQQLDDWLQAEKIIDGEGA